MKEKLYWAKVREDAKIPTKRVEDAGYDMYPCFDEEIVRIEPQETKMIPLGIASSFDASYAMILKERGSTGTKGIAQRSGVIDSGYRGEYIAPITNLNKKPVAIVKKEFLEKLEKERNDYLDEYERSKNKDVLNIILNGLSEFDKLKRECIIYPYEKAICQGVLVKIPSLEQQEISYEELKMIKSERGEGKLGSSGK